MKARDEAITTSLDDADEFIIEFADVLGTIPTCGARVKLQDARAILDVHFAAQDEGVRSAMSATDTKRTLRTHLEKEVMSTISRVATAEQPNVPELRPFKSVRGAFSYRRLISAAEGMAVAVLPYKDTFIAAGLAPDFITQLQGATDALKASLTTPSTRRRKAIGATAGVKKAIISGRQAIHVLDALISIALKHDPVRLAQWKSAKRVKKARTITSTTTNPATTPAAGVSSAA